MRRRSLSLATLATIVATCTAATAQTGLIDGQVTKVDQSASKITIKHGPIPKLDMDQSMTMVFAVSEPSLLKAAKAGDKVKFDAERVNGQLTLTKLQKAK